MIRGVNFSFDLLPFGKFGLRASKSSRFPARFFRRETAPAMTQNNLVKTIKKTEESGVAHRHIERQRVAFHGEREQALILRAESFQHRQETCATLARQFFQ